MSLGHFFLKRQYLNVRRKKINMRHPNTMESLVYEIICSEKNLLHVSRQTVSKPHTNRVFRIHSNKATVRKRELVESSLDDIAQK